MKQKNLLLFVFAFLFFTSKDLRAQDGTLDYSFGDSGRIANLMGSQSVQVKDGDNHIIFFSNEPLYDIYNYEYDSLIVSRFSFNGTLDSSFGTNGIIVYPQTDDIYIAAADRTPDGKFIVLEYSAAVSSSVLIRFLKTGEIDSSFGVNGTVIIPHAATVKVDIDGKIVCADGITSSPNSIIRVMRFLQNGAVDSSFGTNGISEILLRSSHLRIRLLEFQSDNKIIASGIFDDPDVPFYRYRSHFIVSRFTTNGRVDSSFNKNGYNYLKTNFGIDYLNAVLSAPDNGMIAAGSIGGRYDEYSSTYSGGEFGMVKLFENGSVDTAFGNQGWTICPIGKSNDSSSYIASLALQPDGKIVAGGGYYREYEYDNSKFALCRINQNGLCDSTFGNNGIAITDFISLYPNNSVIASIDNLYIEGDGKLLAVGNIYAGDNYNGWTSGAAFARYNNTSVLPINLISFTATKKQSTSLLQWHTCSETNCKGFAIERSSDNKTFTTIGFAASKGGGNKCNNDYSFIDNTPTNGINYYRLKILDNDGKFTYSNVDNLSFIISSLIKISPNPVTDILKVGGSDAMQNYELRIMNGEGKVVATAKTNDDVYFWNISSLKNGVYYLVATNESGEKQTVKFIKQ